MTYGSPRGAFLNAAHLEMTGSANESCGATRRRSFCSEFTDLASIIDEHWDDGFIDCFLDRSTSYLSIAV